MEMVNAQAITTNARINFFMKISFCEVPGVIPQILPVNADLFIFRAFKPSLHPTPP
jgi:hypothetical protein